MSSDYSHHPLHSNLRMFLLDTPNSSWWTWSLVWLVRVVTISLLTRTYIGPWVLALLSTHVRVRSVSFWSIRGLYIRRGNKTWRVERISYAWSYVEGSRRLAVKIDGLSVEVGRSEPNPSTIPFRRHTRSLTLADLAPSPMAYQLWHLVSGVYVMVEPSFRPLFRSCVVACLRLFIRWLPGIAEAVTFDLQSTAITLSELPGAQIVADKIHLHTALAFTPLEKPKSDVDVDPLSRGSSQRRSYSMHAWRRRFTDSFQRSLARAWGETHGAAHATLSFHDVVGSMHSHWPSPTYGKTIKFFNLPGAIDFRASLSLKPREGIIDAQSVESTLAIGPCSIKVDALISFLETWKTLQEFAQDVSGSNPPDNLSPPKPAFLDMPTLTGSISPTVPTSPTSPSPPSNPVTVEVPRSPLLGALSASVRSRRYRFYQPRMRLKDAKTVSLFSIFKHFNLNISKITLSSQPEDKTETYEATFRNVALSVGPSDPIRNSFHKDWLGRGQVVDTFDSDPYHISVSIHKMTVQRRTVADSLRLITLGAINSQILASQWPSPWIAASAFMRGDPNASLLVFRAKIEGIELTERVEHLRLFVDRLGQSKQQSVDRQVVKSASRPVPRIALDIECGPIRCRVLCPPSAISAPLAIELRTNGFAASLTSSFSTGSLMPSPISDRDHLPLRMDAKLTASLQSVYTRVGTDCLTTHREEFSCLGASDLSFLENPALLSIKTLVLSAEANAIALVQDDLGSVAYVDSSSFISDLHLATDTMCIELWHPTVITAITRSLARLPPVKKVDRPAPRLLDQLPSGLSTTMNVARFVVYLTAPDINPQDTLELSRGVACRAGISLQYCSIQSSQAHRFKNLPYRSQTRHKLYLPEERQVEAVAAAKVATPTQDVSAFVRILVTDLALRSAVATQYVSDDPLLAERDDPSLGRREFLRVGSIRADLRFFGKREIPSLQTEDRCEVSVQIPYIRATFQLAHVYSTLLALGTLRSWSPIYSQRPGGRPSGGRLTYHFHGSITVAQISWDLPQQRLVTRFDGVNVQLMHDGLIQMRWERSVVWGLLPPPVNRWEEEEYPDERWKELLNLQMWELSIPRSSGALSVAVAGDSARLVIPSGYVLADLILDAIVTMKAVRHLVQIVASGSYTSLPTPEQEGPKAMPRLTFIIRCLCLEISDDPFESRLSAIWRTGSEAVKHRMDREVAFKAKVATILAADSGNPPFPGSSSELGPEYQFSTKHSISIGEARQRLDEVHALDWSMRLDMMKAKHAKLEDAVSRKLRGTSAMKGASKIPNLVHVSPAEQVPPLFRAMSNDLTLTVTPPSFSIDRLPDFLHEHGDGLPRDTQFSLLIPMHLNFTLSSLQVTLRDYPLPLVDIPRHEDPNHYAWSFDTDLVIGEEMGSDLAVDWIDCPILEPHYGLYGAPPLSLSVPKTIMPVKSYANPEIQVTTHDVTSFSWGVSYGPATHDLMRIVETLSSSPRDSSPGIGFWDKMRLIFHWSLRATFKGEVRLHMKGSRDPHNVEDSGAGFVLVWRGNTKLLIGCQNKDTELIQVISDSMLVAIPNLQHITGSPSSSRSTEPFQKICAKFQSGVRYGVGFVMERSCGAECINCDGTAFHRKCRHFNFRPHYDVRLERKTDVPMIKGPDDSYNGFRSDFVHLSLSLTSSTRTWTNQNPSAFHLTPKAFAHFWSWWELFDSVLSLPIRQGSYYPPRPFSPKLGRHLATLKYRVSVPRLFIMHAYMDDSRETWSDGVTPWIGVKGMIDEFHADMHQRDQETVVPGLIPNTTKVTRRKPFYAAEVVLKGLDLRALLATFDEPIKQSVPVTSPPQRSNYRTCSDLPVTAPSSPWHDPDDFVEMDWSISAAPNLHLLPITLCPHFTYFKRNVADLGDQVGTSKFGMERSHTCLLGKEPSVPQVQISLTTNRIAELKETTLEKPSTDNDSDRASLEKMIALLEDYIALLRENESTPNKSSQSYHLPSDTVSPDEWAEFDHVYQIHCPKLFMDNAIRDIMMQYYYSSRARRGLEYHMATRAVKFIRDQADAALAVEMDDNPGKVGAASTAQIAASALRKILKGETSSKSSVEITHEGAIPPADTIDPLNGWSEGVSLRKSHCCLLLKPQVVLRGEGTTDACVVAAVQAKLQSFAIMDDANQDDPVSGKVMSRSYTSLSGMQTFSPTHPTIFGDGCVPLEVLIDLRCESNKFDRLVPQTDATFHYDKFNRLRLRNNVTSAIARTSTENSSPIGDNHLQDQTDLIQIHIPQFTVSANDEHFQAISHIVTKLLLFSNAAHKTRLDKLETLLFTYDFTDLASAAKVIVDLQRRLRDAMEAHRSAQRSSRLIGDDGKLELMNIKAHIFLLAEELGFLFDAIKLAQDRIDDKTDHKSALLFHASSSEISWRMLDESRDLITKIVAQDIDYYWLSRQDSSTVNNLSVGNLQAFDGSRHALWAEILSKYNEPVNHPLLKRHLFLLANWTVLAPVGGIAIYESFELSLHPLRLQIDARVGRRIMEYVWPARRHRQQHTIEEGPSAAFTPSEKLRPRSIKASRSSLDSPRTLQGLRVPSEASQTTLVSPLRKLGASRSFTDLRRTADTLKPPSLQRTYSSEGLRQPLAPSDLDSRWVKHRVDSGNKGPAAERRTGGAAEMKTRSSQKSFVLVRISSLHLLLSIMKEGSFECRDAKISTRDLEYRNRTWSFEELVDQFIPTDMSWRGWVKMAFHQPLVPVLPVARELISKTKWIASSKGGPDPETEDQLTRAEVRVTKGDTIPSRGNTLTPPPRRGWSNLLRKKAEPPPIKFTSAPLSVEPESLENDGSQDQLSSRTRVLSLFSRTSSRPTRTDSSGATLTPFRRSEEKPGNIFRRSDGVRK